MNTNILKNKQFKKKYPIELVPFNKEWKNWYEEEKNQLLYILKDFTIKIYHIGSTAIPNIYSKIIIDILIEINDNNDFNNIINILSKNWELRWKEDNRAFLVKGYGPNGFLKKVFHLHIRKKGDIDEVIFKEILLNNPDVARIYEKLKLKLEIEYKFDREAYTNGKSELINKIKKD